MQVNQTLHGVWLSPGLEHIHFWGLLLPNGILPGAKFTLRPSLVFSYIGTLLHGTRVVRVSQTLRRGTNNGRNFRSSSFSTEGDTYNLRAAITLGICKPLVIFNERYNID